MVHQKFCFYSSGDKQVNYKAKQVSIEAIWQHILSMNIDWISENKQTKQIEMEVRICL